MEKKMMRPFVGLLLVASAVLLAHADDCWMCDAADFTGDIAIGPVRKIASEEIVFPTVEKPVKAT